jgi:hypothetical protein
MRTVRRHAPLLRSRDEDAPPPSLRRAANLTALLGAIYSLLFLASIWALSGTPTAGASDQEIIDYYGGNDKQLTILAAIYLFPFSAVAFLWFLVLLREWTSYSVHRISRLLSNVQLLSGISYITLSFAAAAASSVTAAVVQFTDSPIDPVSAREFPTYGRVLFVIFGMRMAAMFVLTTTNIGRVAGVFPRWFTILSFAIAIFLLLVASVNTWLILVFPVWVLCLSGLLFKRARAIPRELTVPRELPGKPRLWKAYDESSASDRERRSRTIRNGSE